MEKLLKSRMKNHECCSTPPFSGMEKKTKVSINSKENCSLEMERDAGLNTSPSSFVFLSSNRKYGNLLSSDIFFFEIRFLGEEEGGEKEEFRYGSFRQFDGVLAMDV